MIEIRRVTNPLDPVIGVFGKLQRRVYFEADMLMPASVIRAMLSVPMMGRSNFFLVAEEYFRGVSRVEYFRGVSRVKNGKLLGGTVFHYFSKPNTGFSSFMGVAPEARGRGIARKLHQARFATLHEAAGGKVEGVFIDVVSPERLTPEELEAERRVGFDPVTRRKVFQALGFRQVDVEYQQPVGGPEGGPVTNMDLLYCPHESTETVSTALVVETLRGYWTPWLGPIAAKRHAEALRERAKGEVLALLPPI